MAHGISAIVGDLRYNDFGQLEALLEGVLDEELEQGNTDKDTYDAFKRAEEIAVREGESKRREGRQDSGIDVQVPKQERPGQDDDQLVAPRLKSMLK